MALDLFKIFRGTVANDETGTNARSAAQGINENMDLINNELTRIDSESEKTANKVGNLDAPNDENYPTSNAVANALSGISEAAELYADGQLVNYQPKHEKGQPEGYAGLDQNSKVPAANTYAAIDEIIEGEYINATTFNDVDSNPVTPGAAKLYQDITTGNPNSGKQYRWSGTQFSPIPSSPGTTDEVPEGSSNVYFTAARVRAVILTGYTAITGVAVTAADTIVAAIGKLQGQINTLSNAIGGKLDKGTYTGTAQALYDFANTKETPLGAQAKADAAYNAAVDYANTLTGGTIPAETFADLPAVGEEDVLYLVKDENQLYTFDDFEGLYFAEGAPDLSTEVTDHETRITTLESGGAGGTAPIAYTDMAALYAGQANQVLHGNYRVDDASGHPDVNAGRAWFDYKGTTAGDPTDYILKSEEESLNLDAQLTAIENRLTALEAKEEFTLAEKDKLASLKIEGAILVSSSRALALSDHKQKLCIADPGIVLTYPAAGLGEGFEFNAVTNASGTLQLADENSGNDIDGLTFLPESSMGHVFKWPAGLLTTKGDWE